MSELWGVQSGQAQAQELNMKQQMANMALSEGAIDTQQKEVNLKASELALQQQQTVMKRLASMGSSGQADGQSTTDPITQMSDYLFRVADAQIHGGQFEQGAATADKAGNLALNQAKIEEATHKQAHQLWTDVSNALAGVHDETSLKSALSDFKLAHPDEVNLPATQKMLMQLQQGGYDQAKIDKLKEISLDQKTKAEIGAAQARAKQSDAAAKRDEAEVPLAEARTREKIAREKALEKVGGADKVPPAAEISTAMDFISKEYTTDDSNTSKASARLEATQIAQEAAEIRASTPGLSVKDSIEKVYKAHKAGGDLSGLRPASQAIGASAEKSLPIPKDLTKLKDNTWYIAPDEKGNLVPQLWDGSSFRTREDLTLDEAHGYDEDDEDDDDEPAK